MLRAERINHIIEHSACPLCFCPGVEARRSIQPFVSEDLPYYLIITRLLVEEHLASKVPEQMNVERVAGKLKDDLFNLQAKRMGRLVLTITPWEQGISWFTHQMGSILFHIPAQDIQGIFRDVKINRMPVFGLAFANDQMNLFALLFEVPVNIDRAKIGFARSRQSSGHRRPDGLGR